MNNVELRKRIQYLLRSANQTYQTYLSNEKKFVYANALYAVNVELSHLILEYGHLLQGIEQDVAIELNLHLQVWSQQWLELKQQQSPALDEPFVFNTMLPFPPRVNTTFQV
ncbi:hypothetical protein V1358_15160 [Pseudoalteromonas sp. YIC-656]|uniref:hypothetical protein n=1 Tax=Pseudoalteromonas pernae TaxID=3118054 RepID=UPI003242A2D9